MKEQVFDSILEALFEGKLDEVSLSLAPFLAVGDHDAQFIDLHFSDGSISGDDFDRRRIDGLRELAKKGHAKSMYALSEVYRFGDEGVDADKYLYLAYLAAASLAGEVKAKHELAEILTLELNIEERRLKSRVTD